MPHAPDPRTERLLAQALLQEADAGPPADFVEAVMARLARQPPSAWFERGLAVGAVGAFVGVTAWAALSDPELAAAWNMLPALPTAPALAWAAAALAVQALLQARRGGVR